MFNLKSVLGNRILLSEDFAKILGNALNSSNISQGLPSLMDHFSKLLGGLAPPAASAAQVAQALTGNGTASISPASVEALGPALTKIAFIAVLAESIEDAKNKKNFNVETAINDLWVKLNRVRPQQNPAVKEGISELTAQISAILSQQTGVVKTAVRNLR